MKWPYLDDQRDRCRIMMDDPAALDAFNQIESTVEVMQMNGCFPFEAIPGVSNWQAARVQMLRHYCESEGLDFDTIMNAIEQHRIK